MKYKTTRKAVVAGTPSNSLVSIGYCDAQTLLRNHSAVAYTCGVYGWNFDVYEVYGLTICTGYRGMPGRWANNVQEYERRARDILNGSDWTDWRERDAKIENLLQEFCAQA